MYVFRLVSLAAIALVAATAVAPKGANALPMIAVTCEPANLTLAVAKSNDNGMLHDAVYLALINTGSETCSVPGHPHVSLLDATGKTIVDAATTRPLLHVHPGPVVIPQNIPPGAAIVTEIRWAYANGNPSSPACSKVATVALEGIDAPLATSICGDDTPGAQPHLDVRLYASAS